MDNHFRDLANRLFKSSSAGLTELEEKVIRHLAERRHISRNINREFDEKLTFGQRLADRVAAFGAPGHLY